MFDMNAKLNHSKTDIRRYMINYHPLLRANDGSFFLIFSFFRTSKDFTQQIPYL